MKKVPHLGQTSVMFFRTLALSCSETKAHSGQVTFILLLEKDLNTSNRDMIYYRQDMEVNSTIFCMELSVH